MGEITKNMAGNTGATFWARLSKEYTAMCDTTRLAYLIAPLRVPTPCFGVVMPARISDADLRAKLLTGVQQLLHDHTLSSITVDMLAHELSMSKSTLYRCYNSKEHLFLALIDPPSLALAQWFDRHAATLALCNENALRVWAKGVVHYLNTMPPGFWVTRCDLPPLVAERLQCTRSQMQQQLARVLHMGGKQHRLPLLPVSPCVAAIMGTLTPSTLQVLSATTSATGDAWYNAFATIFYPVLLPSALGVTPANQPFGTTTVAEPVSPVG